MGIKTLIKYQCKIFNFVDLSSGVGIVWPTTTRTRVSDATVVTFSVKCFNQLKLYVKHLEKVVCFILFIYSRAFNNNVISSGKSHWCNDTFTDVRFTSLLAKNILIKNTNYFTLLESAFHYLFRLKFSFKLVTFSKSYARKQKWVFFSEHSVHTCGKSYTENKSTTNKFVKKIIWKNG